jgi:RNA polymerase sigma-B factor
MTLEAAARRGPARGRTAELQRAYGNGDLAARERLIEAYLPLVRSLAGRFAHSGEAVEDLVQVGSIGLIKAVDRFDPERGVELGAFAAPNILGEIKRHLRDRATPIRLPRRHQEVGVKVRAARRQLADRLAREPTPVELAAAAELDERDVDDALRVEQARAPVPLTEAAPAVSADEVFDASEHRVALSRGMRRLHRRERQALRCRFFEDMSQDEIAERLGISQTQTSRLLASGLAKLRTGLEENTGSSDSRAVHSFHGVSRRGQGRAARRELLEAATARR